MHIDIHYEGRMIIVRLSGELDHHAADHVRLKIDEAIAHSQCKHVILSLKQLQFMDSSGLGLILGRYNLLKNKGGKLAICHVNSAVYRLFEMSGLFKIMPVYENEQTACSGLEVVS